MGLFKWTKLHAAYVPEVDAEHRNIFRLGEELQQAAAAAAGSEKIQEITRTLLAACEDHFSHEEQLMKAAEYPTFAWHKQQHDGARRRLKQFASLIEGGDPDAPLLCTEYLSHWIKNHTTLTDRMMGAYLRNFARHQAVAS
jgi:hemerythrin